MSEQMNFPEKWEEFIMDYAFSDIKEIYTNGSSLIPVFRVKQMMDHYLKKEQEKIEKLQKPQWIPCSERLPDKNGSYLVTCIIDGITKVCIRFYDCEWESIADVIAWMPLPKPYEEREE